MPDSRLKAYKATVILKGDHKNFKALFAKYEKLGTPDADQKEDIFLMLKAELGDHATVEEEIFYPACAEAATDDAQEIVREAQEEHKIVKTLLFELSELEVGSVDFEAKMKVLRENVERHADEEESRIFPLFRKLRSEQQDEVSGRLRDRKIELSEGDGE
jgi:hemerythrin superfamily protein